MPWRFRESIFSGKMLKHLQSAKLIRLEHLHFNAKHFIPVKGLLLAMYFIGRLALFFANNSLTECWITMEFLHNSF